MYSREHERNSGKHGHSSWAAVPVSDMAETQDTRWTEKEPIRNNTLISQRTDP